MTPPHDDPEKPLKKGPDASDDADPHLHDIELEDLIVHRYADHDSLFAKADKGACELIDSELREGEGMRIVRPGSYQLYFPKLTPEAGELRCAVIAEKVARLVREINPTWATVTRMREQKPEKRTARPSAPTPFNSPAAMEAASRALARMAEVQSSEDDKLTAWDAELLAKFGLLFHPIWHTKNNLITGYYCEPTYDGGPVSIESIGAITELTADTAEGIAAKIDALIYRHAATAIEFLLQERLKALLIVPLHFSTVDRLRFINPLLSGVGQLPDEAKNLLVFELKDLPDEVSRFRLREPASYLRTRARALLAQTCFNPTALELYKELGFHGISVDASRYPWKEAKLLKGFERFVQDAESYKLQSFAHGIRSKSLAVSAIASGFRYMDGTAVSDPISHPRHIQPYEIDMLYEN